MNHSRIKNESIIEQAVLKQLSVDDMEEFKKHVHNCNECMSELLTTKLLYSAAEVSGKNTDNKNLTIPFYAAIFAAMLRISKKHVVAISIVALVVISAIVLETQFHFLSLSNSKVTLASNSDAFIPNDHLETIINTNLRSGTELSVSSPEPDFQFGYDENSGFLFSLEASIVNAKEKEIVFKILSNNETDYLNDESLYAQEVGLKQDSGTTRLSLEEQLFLSEGMYYLTLQYKNEIDYLYVARIYVNK